MIFWLEVKMESVRK